MKSACITLLFCSSVFAGEFEVKTWKQEIVIDGSTIVYETHLVKQRDELVVSRDGLIVWRNEIDDLPVNPNDGTFIYPPDGRNDLGHAYAFNGNVSERISLVWQVPGHLLTDGAVGAAEQRRTSSYVPNYNPNSNRYEPTEIENGYPEGLPVSFGDGWWQEYPLGDIDLDGTFNSTDLIRLLSGNDWGPGYEWGRESEPPYEWVTYFNGDFNNDGYFDSLDIMSLFQAGTYDRGLDAAIPVPEPQGRILTIIVLLFCARKSWSLFAESCDLPR